MDAQWIYIYAPRTVQVSNSVLNIAAKLSYNFHYPRTGMTHVVVEPGGPSTTCMRLYVCQTPNSGLRMAVQDAHDCV